MLIKFLGWGMGKGQSFLPSQKPMEKPHHKPESDISQATQHGDLLPMQKDITSDPYYWPA